MNLNQRTLSLRTRIVAAILLTMGFLSPSAADNSHPYVLLATATTGGTCYPVGVALATLTKVKLEPKHNISLSATSSAGLGENLKLLRENQAQLTILQ